MASIIRMPRLPYARNKLSKVHQFACPRGAPRDYDGATLKFAARARIGRPGSAASTTEPSP
jgi:hypothetical protein